MASSATPPTGTGAAKEFASVPGISAGSVWRPIEVDPKFPKLEEDITADVIVVGGGIAGLTTAYNLVKEGKDVAVIESRVRTGAMTGRTTAHVMRWWDDYYYEMESMHGKEKTQLLASAMDFAVDFVEETVKAEGIDCQFMRTDGYLFPHATGESSQPTSSTSALEKEYAAAMRAGMTDIKKVDLGGGPEVGGIKEALLFPRNGEFHPIKYCEGLCEAIVKKGGRIYEQSLVRTPYDDHVEMANGIRARAREAVVLATNSPINRNLAIHARQEPYRSYVVGLKIRREDIKRAEFWDTAEPYHYTRCIEMDDEHYVLIVGGEDHKTGFWQTYDPYDRLEEYARSRWTGAKERVFAWNGQVMEPSDALHLHGRDPLKGSASTTYVITGDSGQGMTGSTIGGRVVADLILGKSNPWSDLFSPSRSPKGITAVIEEGAVTTASLVERLLPKISLSYEDMEPDTGRIVQHGLHKMAVYNDAQNQKHMKSAVCTHLGCIVHWDKYDKIWACPCHGANFDCMGRVINGPATKDLEDI